MKYKYDNDEIKAAIEEFKKKEKGDGKRGPFYNGKQKFIFDINNVELFQNAVWQGYLDASRTFSGIKNTNKEQEPFKNLAGHIQKYFAENEEFDHEGWCDQFIGDIKNETYAYPNPRYGQAQKVVNMAFKYLRCCDGAKNYAKKFDLCHMPLDQFTLAWYFAEGNELFEEWSYFDKGTYNKVQEGIRNILDNNILDKEFIIWQEMKSRVVNLKDIAKKSK